MNEYLVMYVDEDEVQEWTKHEGLTLVDKIYHNSKNNEPLYWSVFEYKMPSFNHPNTLDLFTNIMMKLGEYPNTKKSKDDIKSLFYRISYRARNVHEVRYRKYQELMNREMNNSLDKQYEELFNKFNPNQPF